MTARSRTPRPTVNVSNVQKVFFPKAKFTKGDVIAYYNAIAPYILPHLRNRPVTLIRFPDGVTGESFYEKNAPKFTPEWVKTFGVPRHRSGGTIRYILINDAATLTWCANLAAIELHPFLHRAPKLDRPTSVAFDLDPGEGATLLTCIEVAFLIKEVLDQLGLKAFPKVSGSKGLQLYVPLNTPVTYEVTSPFAKAMAELLAQRHPDRIVSRMSKELRRKRVMIDWSQNNPSKTTVCVYAMRAKRDEPFISMPVEWKELSKALKSRDTKPLSFSPAQALARVRKRGDLFAPVLTLQQRLPKSFSTPAVARTARAALRTYEKKRDFTKTAEPSGRASGPGAQPGPLRFVIQKHAASHLHYDFRLEADGTLKSWAVPKGLPGELHVKRSAFETEDHPIEYLQFEGTIPKGQYGGGTVMVWDIGTYEVTDGDLRRGSVRVRLAGTKLKGEWRLFRIRSENGKNVWLVEKSGRGMRPISARQEDSSALTRRSMARIARDNSAQWQSDRA